MWLQGWEVTRDFQQTWETSISRKIGLPRSLRSMKTTSTKSTATVPDLPSITERKNIVQKNTTWNEQKTQLRKKIS